MNIAFIPHDKRATLNFCTKGGNQIFSKWTAASTHLNEQ
jgi:hypothetical protein